MVYGVKRGVRAPGEFGATDIFGLALAGSAGIIAALVTNYQQSGEASALYTINQWVVWLGDFLQLGDIPLWMVVVGLIATGAGSVFYFQPITRQGAFAQGFGLLAVIMTAVPADRAGGIEPMTDHNLPELESISTTREAALDRSGIIRASYQAQEARVYTVQARREAARYEVNLTVTFPDGLPPNIDSLIRRGLIRGRLHNADTKETFNLFRTAGGTLSRQGNSLVISAGVPARSETATLWVRIECVGHRIEEQSTQASLSQPLHWNITMQSSNTPLWMQRLRKSYRY